jgi:hypothetical protein
MKLSIRKNGDCAGRSIAIRPAAPSPSIRVIRMVVLRGIRVAVIASHNTT